MSNFTQDDFTSLTWKKMESLMQEKLESCRNRNDYLLTQEETNFIRGKISVYRELLSIKEQGR